MFPVVEFNVVIVPVVVFKVVMLPVVILLVVEPKVAIVPVVLFSVVMFPVVAPKVPTPVRFCEPHGIVAVGTPWPSRVMQFDKPVAKPSSSPSMREAVMLIDAFLSLTQL